MKRKAVQCQRCPKRFVPTGPNCKRCPPCRRAFHLESCKKRWHKTYEKKGYNQAGSKNNAWKGGKSPQFYQKVAYETHGTDCMRCGKPAVLVHHKDGDKGNSTTTNLEVLCKRCHQLEHSCSDNLPDQVVLKRKFCVSCNSRFQPTGPRSQRCRKCVGQEAKV